MLPIQNLFTKVIKLILSIRRPVPSNPNQQDYITYLFTYYQNFEFNV